MVKQISGKKYRKLSKNLFAKAIKSSVTQQLTFEFKLNNQLYLLYYPKDIEQVFLSQKVYNKLIHQIEDLEFQLNQMEKAKELGLNDFSEFFSD
ncbi:hypothetical protein RhiirC2_783767 [Rhizophagus irregularis]|uniref:Uncharacterized protein n=1 Tax=Rhizophagus irregularis TaxID=588596 RepID=A0A2N1N003_9GLOM|nr:hypothetical protein RhiirC2_783767 [Rhizophagus irregularis]